jgi:glutamine cyclotransferase
MNQCFARTIIVLLGVFVMIIGGFSSCRDTPGETPEASPASGNGSGSSGNGAGADSGRPPLLTYQVLNVYPHDTTSYTEGLLMQGGELYESTGHIGVKAELDRNKYFGEGIVFLKGRVYQLTYKTKVGFIYDAKTFKKLGEFTYPSKQGWGMTTDGTYLIMSDSTPDIHYLDPATFKLVRSIKVMENNTPVDQVNELEYINGYIYANRYTKNYILKIDPASGRVVGKLDLSSLNEQAHNKYHGSMEMNGIAYDSATDKVYVTGKLWPDIYTIRFPH